MQSSPALNISFHQCIFCAAIFSPHCPPICTTQTQTRLKLQIEFVLLEDSFVYFVELRSRYNRFCNFGDFVGFVDIHLFWRFFVDFVKFCQFRRFCRFCRFRLFYRFCRFPLFLYTLFQSRFYAQVKTVKPGSPAEAVGLQPSDFILRINGQIVFHLDPKDVERLINNSGFALLLDIER